MSLLITMGLGVSGGGGSGSFFVDTITPAIGYVDLTFNIGVKPLTLLATDPANWVFTTTGDYDIEAISLTVTDETVRVYTTEAKNGEDYSLQMPGSGLRSILDDFYDGDEVLDFTGVGQSPTIALAAADDGYHLRVVFSEAVNVDDALTAANYSIPGLTVFSVSRETDSVYIIQTSLQAVGDSYTLTVSNIRDAFGNII